MVSPSFWSSFEKSELILVSRCLDDTRGLRQLEGIHKNVLGSILIRMVSQCSFRDQGEVIHKAVGVSWSNISFWPPFTLRGEIIFEVLCTLVKLCGKVLSSKRPSIYDVHKIL